MSEEIQFTEQSLREALERLGSKSDKKTTHKPDQGNEAGTMRPFFSGANSFMNSSSGKKRRFINDGGVVVEHRKDIGRYNSKSGLAGKTLNDRQDTGERHEEVLKLQKSLAREQKRVIAAETEIEDLKEKVRSLETRLAHYQFQIDEREKKLSLLKDDNIKLKLRDKRNVSTARNGDVTKKKIKDKTKSSLNNMFQEQEPVKWWNGE